MVAARHARRRSLSAGVLVTIGGPLAVVVVVLGLGIWLFEQAQKIRAISARRRARSDQARQDPAPSRSTVLPYGLQPPPPAPPSPPPPARAGEPRSTEIPFEDDNERAIRLMARHEATGDLDALQEGVELFRRDLAHPADDEIPRSSRLANLATALRTRFTVLEETADIDESVGLARQALAEHQDEDPERGQGTRPTDPSLENCLANALYTRFLSTGDMADLDEAVVHDDNALAVAPPGHPIRPSLLTEAADRRRRRWAEWQHQASGLDTSAAAEPDAEIDMAVRLAREAHELATAAASDVADALLYDADAFVGTGVAAVLLQTTNGLAVVLGARSESATRTAVQRIADEDEAIDLLDRGLRLVPLGNINRSSIALNYATLMANRYDRTGDPGTMDRVGELAEVAMPRPPLRTDVRTHRGVLGGVAFRRFGARGSLGDIDTVVREFQAIVVDTGNNDAIALANLSMALQSRYEAKGTASDLADAVDVGWQAVTAAGRGGSRGDALFQLGTVLLARYENGHAISDLHASIDSLRAAVDLLPAGRKESGNAANNLGAALLARYISRRSVPDLNEAIEHLVGALEGLPESHPQRPTCLGNLAHALKHRAELLRRAGLDEDADQDMDRAVECGLAAASALPDDHPERAWHCANAGAYLTERFDTAGRPDDLEAAGALFEEALATVRSDHVERFRHQINLANHLFHRYRVSESGTRTGPTTKATLPRARALAEEALSAPIAPAPYRLLAARLLGQIGVAEGDWRAAHEAFARGVALIPVLAWHGLDHSDREELLSTAATLASDAAATALSAGVAPERAVELLEQGRGVLLSQALDAANGPDAVRAAAPDLARRMREVRRALDGTAAGPLDGSPPESAGADAWSISQAEALALQRRQEWAARWDTLVREAGERGVETFLGVPKYTELRKAAAYGPVVLVNVSRYRCDAFVLTGGTPTVVPLRGLSQEKALQGVGELLNALASTADQEPGGASEARDTLRAVLRDQCAWLWREVALPVLTLLDIGPSADGTTPPRLWWCPTGPLAHLPLHAAGLHPTPGKVPGGSAPRGSDERADAATLLDRVMCSYTPTLRFLADVRRREVRARSGPPDLLAVAVPDVPGMELPMAEEELRAVVAEFTEVAELKGDQATLAAVRSALPGRSFFHFAGHGSQDPLVPGSAGLYCHDFAASGLLTFADIAGMRLSGAELAFLSACETARGTARSADESVHMAGALNIAGFRHVIASQWPINDVRAVTVAASFYRALAPRDSARSAADRSAWALHTAVRRLRAQRPEALDLWAPYVHSGP